MGIVLIVSFRKILVRRRLFNLLLCQSRMRSTALSQYCSCHILLRPTSACLLCVFQNEIGSNELAKNLEERNVYGLPVTIKLQIIHQIKVFKFSVEKWLFVFNFEIWIMQLGLLSSVDEDSNVRWLDPVLDFSSPSAAAADARQLSSPPPLELIAEGRSTWKVWRPISQDTHDPIPLFCWWPSAYASEIGRFKIWDLLCSCRSLTLFTFSLSWQTGKLSLLNF